MVEPIGHFVLVEMPAKEKTTAGGIIIPDEVSDKEHRAAHCGKLIGVGGDCSKVKSQMVGKSAYFGRYAGMLFELDDAEYRLIDEDEIRAIA